MSCSFWCTSRWCRWCTDGGRAAIDGALALAPATLIARPVRTLPTIAMAELVDGLNIGIGGPWLCVLWIDGNFRPAPLLFALWLCLWLVY